MRLNYATGYGSRVHILSESRMVALCGVTTHEDWAKQEDPKPSDVCKSCYKSAERDGLINYQPCAACGGTGKTPEVTNVVT